MKRSGMALAFAGLALMAGTLGLRAEPGMVRLAIEQARARCTAAGGNGSPGAGFVSTSEFNGDRQPDYVLDFARYNCRTRSGSNPFCTPLGCQVEVFLSSRSGGYTSAFRGSVKGWRARRIRNHMQFQVALLGAFCGSRGKGGCSEHREAKGSQFALVGYGLESFGRDAPVTQTASTFQPPGSGEESLPQELMVPDGPFVPSGANAPVQRRDLSNLPFVP